MTRLSDLSEAELAELRAGRIPGEPIDLPDCGYQVFDDVGDLSEDIFESFKADDAAFGLTEIEGDGSENLETADDLGRDWLAISVEEAQSDDLLTGDQSLARLDEPMILYGDAGVGGLKVANYIVRGPDVGRMHRAVLVNE